MIETLDDLSVSMNKERTVIITADSNVLRYYGVSDENVNLKYVNGLKDDIFLYPNKFGKTFLNYYGDAGIKDYRLTEYSAVVLVSRETFKRLKRDYEIYDRLSHLTYIHKLDTDKFYLSECDEVYVVNDVRSAEELITNADPKNIEHILIKKIDSYRLRELEDICDYDCLLQLTQTKKEFKELYPKTTGYLVMDKKNYEYIPKEPLELSELVTDSGMKNGTNEAIFLTDEDFEDYCETGYTETKLQFKIDLNRSLSGERFLKSLGDIKVYDLGPRVGFHADLGDRCVLKVSKEDVKRLQKEYKKFYDRMSKELEMTHYDENVDENDDKEHTYGGSWKTYEIDLEPLKEELLNGIREEFDLGFEDWKPELKKFIKKAIKKAVKKEIKKHLDTWRE